MSLILLAIEFADRNFITELGDILIGMPKDTHFALQKHNRQIQKASVLVYKKLAQIWVEQWKFGLQSAWKHSS